MGRAGWWSRNGDFSFHFLNVKLTLYLSFLDLLLQKHVFSSSKGLIGLNSFKSQSIDSSGLLEEKYY